MTHFEFDRSVHALNERSRVDVFINTTSPHFVACPADRAGWDPIAQGDSVSWNGAVFAGACMPVDTAKAGPVIVRVVHGELAAAEREQWVGRRSWKLDLSSGQLAIADVHWILESDSSDSTPLSGEVIAVPAGIFEVVVHTYLSAPSGIRCLTKGGHLESVSIDELKARHADWYPDQPLPDWLSGQRKTPWVDYLVQLLPRPDGLLLPELDRGFFVEADTQFARRFPRGLPAEPVNRPSGGSKPGAKGLSRVLRRRR